MKINRIAVFGGTCEGRTLAESLVKAGARVHVFVATSYGEDLIPAHEGLSISCGRLNSSEMTDAFKSGGFNYIVDATHPYADEATANIQKAANQVNVPYMRVIRGDSENGDEVQADSGYSGEIRSDSDYSDEAQAETGCSDEMQTETAEEAAHCLNHLDGNILLTTGTGTLQAFADILDRKERVFVRILPDADAVNKCVELGFSKGNLICMQGPFSFEMNTATIEMHNIAVLVTKDSGDAGGFPEKLSAAKACSVKLVVIRRPDEISEGVSVEKAMKILLSRLKLNLPEPDLRVTEDKPGMLRPGTRFPLFIPLMDKAVLIVGGGKVAARRARVLIDFGALVTVISPEICAEMRELIGQITWKQQRFNSIEQEYSIVLAATDDRNTNKQIGESARSLGIPVSVADKKEESTFWFPAVARGEGIVAGLISESGDHSAVKEAARKVREVLSSAEVHYSNAQEACPGTGDMESDQ